MIAASLNSISQNNIAAERFVRAFAWLEKTDLATLEPGRHDIDGDDLFVNVMAITSTVPADKNYEAHRAYADIHVVIEGEERIGIAPVGGCEEVSAYVEGDDYGLYTYPDDQATWVVLHAGDLCVTPPADAHKPACCGEGGPAPLRKVCIKVRL